METKTLKTEKTASEKKADILKAFAQVLDKHCRDYRDVFVIIHALQDLCEYAEEKRFKYREDVPFDIRHMRDNLMKEMPLYLSTFDDITDDIQAIIMLAGSNAEGTVLVSSPQMRADLYAVSDQFNY